DEVFDKFVSLMERANYKRLSWKDVQAAMEGGASDWSVNMNVDPAVFERLEIFVRGDGVSTRTRRRMLNFWRAEQVKVATYQRLVLMLKLRPHKRLGSGVDTNAVFLKVFKDIPKLDLETLLPGARLEMPRWTKFQLGGTLLSGLVLVVWKIFLELWE